MLDAGIKLDGLQRAARAVCRKRLRWCIMLCNREVRSTVSEQRGQLRMLSTRPGNLAKRKVKNNKLHAGGCVLSGSRDQSVRSLDAYSKRVRARILVDQPQPLAKTGSGGSEPPAREKTDNISTCLRGSKNRPSPKFVTHPSTALSTAKHASMHVCVLQTRSRYALEWRLDLAGNFSENFFSRGRCSSARGVMGGDGSSE